MSVGRPLTTQNALDSETPGALVGKESRDGRDALRFTATETLRVEDVQRGDSGDASDLLNFSIELWWKGVDGLPASADLLVSGPMDTNAQFQYYLTVNPAGTISFHADRNGVHPVLTGGTVTADNTAWYHIVGTIDGDSNNLYVNGVEVASAAGSNAIFPATFTDPFVINDSSSVNQHAYDEVAVYRGTLSADRVLAHYQAGVERGYPIQATGARVAAVLESVNSNAPRSVQAGTRNVSPSFMVGQSPLDEIRRARAAENVDALFFTARDGTLTFLADGHRSSSPYNTVQATFDDDGTDLPYRDLDIDYSDSFLINYWTATRAASVEQLAFDTTSINRYRKRPQTLGDLPVTTDGEASDIADALLAKYKDPFTRITSIQLSTSDPDVTEAVFRRDIGDRIRVFRTPPGGGTRIDQTLFIQKIQVDAAPNAPWRITWAVSPV